MENRSPPLGLESGMVATVVEDPQPQKKPGQEEAVEDRSGGEIEHDSTDS